MAAITPPPANVERAYIQVLKRRRLAKPLSFVPGISDKHADHRAFRRKDDGAVRLRDAGLLADCSREVRRSARLYYRNVRRAVDSDSSITGRNASSRHDPAWQRGMEIIMRACKWFNNLDHVEEGMKVDLSRAPVGLEDYERKAQAMAYDSERAMFEAYSRNKYESTGVIQWMLNNAWPLADLATCTTTTCSPRADIL